MAWLLRMRTRYWRRRRDRALALKYLTKADKLAEDMDTHGYGIVLTYTTLALTHLQLATQYSGRESGG